MSESNSRSSGPRSRGSGRAGRGGFSNRSRGGRNQGSGSKADLEAPSFEDEGQIGELKSKYATPLATIKEMFPDWTDEDIVFALQETDGDLESTIDRITDGNVSQWGEVKKKTKDRSQSKPKEAAAPTLEATIPSARGGRGRGGFDTSRGGRGRGSDRGRAAVRGARGGRGSVAPKINGTPGDNKTPSDPLATDKAVGGWDTATTETDSTQLDSSWEHVTQESAQPIAEEEAPAPQNAAPKTWASMFAKPKPAPPKMAPQAAPNHDAPIEPSVAAPSTSATDGMQGLPPPITAQQSSEIPSTPPTSDLASSDQVANMTPPKDDLTETNLEKLPDDSLPEPSKTAASTVASTVDQRNISGTPLGLGQQQSARPPLGGYATSAYKATGMPGRSASYQRKILEQQEAVVMPGKHVVDKAAVQFGSMGLNGTPEDVDVDSDREDAETRAQPPQHSPVAPRASLPPAPQQQQQGLPLPPAADSQPTQRPAPGLPPVPQPLAAQHPTQQSSAESQPSAASAYAYSQFGDRYGQPSTQPESVPASQKPYEPFGQQLQPSQQYDPFGTTPTQSVSNEARQYGGDKYGTGASNVSSYYTSDDQRSAFQNQYGAYGQQQQPNQDSSLSQPRTGSAIGSSAASQPSQQAAAQSRFGQLPEAQNSGHSTPYSSMPSQQSANAAPSSAPGQHGGFGYGGYPYGGYYSSYMNQMNSHPYGRERPMYDDRQRFEEQYMAQSPGFSYGSGQGGYGGGPFSGAAGKSLYGQQHPGYGISPQTSHDQHSASPANAGAFGQQLPGSGRDSAAPGLSSYGGRTGSTQPSDHLHSSNQSNLPDVFGRSQSGFQGQNQALGSSQDDPLRGYGDTSKVPGGPSPALGQSGARPGSAVNPQTGLPHQDARFGQGGYSGGYGGPTQYGSGPGAGGHQSAQAGHQGYGGYGGGYGGSYYGSNNRGGWGASYGH